MHRGRDTNFNFPYGDNNIDNRKEQGQFIDTGQSLLNEPLSKMSNDDGSVRSKNTNDGKTNINQFREEGESDQPPQGPQQPQQFSFQQGQQFGQQQQQQQQQQQLPFQYNQPQLSIQQQQQIFQQQQQQQQQQPQLPNRPNINPQTQGQYFNAGATSGSEPSSFQYPSLFAASGSSDFGRGLVQQEMMAAQRLSGNSGGYGQQNTQQTPGGGGYGQAAGMGGQGAGYGMGMGQTPMTGGSFNSGAQSQPTPLTGQGGGSGVSSILKASQYGQAGMMDSASSGGGGMGMGDSLLRGNEPLQPTPMVRRGGSLSHEQIQQQMQSMQASQMQGLGQNTPGMNYAGMMNQQQQMPQSEMKGQFPSQHQQQQQQMGQHSQQQHSTGRKRKLEPVEEEDPSMLRYESRPGLDQSPMADTRGALEPEGQCHEVVEKKGIATGQSIGATSAPIRRSSSGQLQDRSGGGTSSSLGQQQDQNIGGSSSAIGAQSSGDGAPLLQEFPFYFDGFAAWVCRHCQHIPPYYRGGNYVWQSATPPPNQYVDSHLRFCPGLNPANVPTQQQVEERQRMQAHMPGQMQGQMQGQQPFGGIQAGMQINQDNSAFPYQMQQQIQQGQNPFMMQQQQQMQQLQQTALQQQQSGGSLQQAGLQHQQSGGIPQDKLQPMKGQDAPDPPAMTSPLTIQQSLKQDSQGGKTTGDKTPGSNVTAPLIQQSQAVAQHQTSPWNAYPGANERQMFQNQPQYPYQPYPQQMMQQQGVGAGGQYPQHMQPQAVALGSANTLPSPADNPPAKRRKSTGSKISPKGRRTDDVTYKAAIDFLTKKTLEIARPLVQSSDVGQSLIDRTDADLLTDYFFYMMQQLVVCRFSEKDRKTRGGKRENINIGYGGLQCIHCIDAPSARKFFWSTVDRLANSFAEIPSHVLKCKHCPENVKNALLDLKGRHPDQMQMLPRGSQKVFFRRMWRRLHDGDSDAGTPLRDSRPNSAMSNRGVDPPPSEVKVPLKSPKIAAPAAAEFLATSARKESKKREAKVPKSLKDTSPGGTVTIAPSSGRQEESPPSSPETAVLLAIPEDKDWLSDMDCFVRNNIEVFSSKQRDVLHAAADRKYPIKIGQVGIRCLHCAEAAGGARGAAVSYPYSISGIYESVREFQRLHLDNCRNVPDNVREASEKIGSGAASLSSVLRRYYVQAARALGLYDTRDGGIRAGGNPVPMSTAGFQTPASSFRPTSASPAEPMGSMAEDPPETGKKRKAGSSPFAEEQVEESGSQEGEPDSKRRKSLKPEDAPGKAGVSFKEQGDAPARGEVPGKEDAPGEKASAPDGVKEEPPGDSPATQGMPRAA